MIIFHIYSGGDLPCAVARWNYSTSIPSLLPSSSSSSSSSVDIMNSNTIEIIIDHLWVLPRLRKQQYAYRCLHSILYFTITNIMTQTTTATTTTTTTTTTKYNDSIKSNSSQGNIKIKIFKEILSHHNYHRHNKDNDNTDDDSHNASDSNSNHWMIEKLKSFGFIIINDDQHHHHMNDHNDYHKQQKSSSIVDDCNNINNKSNNDDNSILNLNHNIIMFSLSYQSISTLQDLSQLLQSKCNM
jgi:hypothetical protein